jgi:hypothetical protein
MADVLVCKDNWSGVKKENFNWHNPGQTDVTISKYLNSPWPFTLPSPIPVKAGVKLACGLIDQANTFYYDSGPCPAKGNPKTVIIT